MKVKEIEIKNFRGINGNGVKFILSDNLNVFVGVNGAGKTTILDTIVTSLSWLVNRIQRENVPGRPIPESSIKNGSTYSSIDIVVKENNKDYKWKIVKTAKGNPSNEKSELTEVSELALYFQDIFRNNHSLPVVAYYPINRVVEAINPKIPVKDSLNILDVYDNALGGKTNYQSFFEWFRLQDDIVNERAQSRGKWMIQNKKWIKNKTTRLLSLFEKMNAEKGDADVLRFIEHFKKDKLIFDEPELFFHELADLFDNAEIIYQKNIKGGDVFKDINYLRIRMKLAPLSYSRTQEISTIERILDRFIRTLRHKEYKDDNNKIIISFIWNALLFSILLYLSWLSEKGKVGIENLFSEFNPVNKDANKVQNESEKFISSINQLIRNDAERLDNATRSEGRELKYVTKSIEKFVPGYSNLRVKRTPRPQMLVDKDGETISLDQLSDGEKNLIALIGDIARRLSIANSNSNKPLEGKGIILIDEIDLHLHPSWQRLMIPKLTELFPNCQFFITTHSPQVLSHIQPENIFLLRNEKNVFSYSKAIESYGQNSDRILEDLLGVDARPKKEKEMLHNLFRLIQEGNLKEAKIKAEELSKLIGKDPEIVKAEVLIKRKEIIGK